MFSRHVDRLWALECVTYVSPSEARVYGDAAPRVPVPVYLMEHRDGLVLFDAGLDPAAVGEPAAVYGQLADTLQFDFREEHLIEHQLDRLGYSIKDVGTVVASHLHFDHAGALRQFPHARTIIGAGELEYAREPDHFSRNWFRPEDFHADLGLQWDVVPCDIDVFGDGSLRVLYMPGHTPGGLAALVRLDDGNLVLSGDVAHNRSDFAQEKAYHGDVDSVAARASLRKLKYILETERAHLWIGHDAADWEHFGGAGEVTLADA